MSVPGSSCCGVSPGLTQQHRSVTAVAVAAAAMAAASSNAVDVGLIRQAMAYRVKYRVVGSDGAQKRRMSLSLLGVHQQNRGGVYPSPDTVQNLGLRLLEVGFSADEANHEGVCVCVQEVPSSDRGADPVDPTKPYQTCKEYNMAHCTDTNTILRTCFNVDSDTTYGTLSHSHLVLALLSMKTGAKWQWPPAWKDIFEHSGALQMAAVAAKDANLASLLTEGILMEVLSWKMYKEEPGACSLISQALNAGQQLALQTSELTALAVLTGRVGLELEGAVASQVSFETVKEKVRTELDQFVDMPDFISLFEFVVNMGANRSSFIKQLLAFGSKFVDQKQRQLRLAAFAEANKLQLGQPRCKIAMLMRAYRKPPSRTWCPTPEPSWGKAERHVGRQEGERERERERER